MLSWKVADRVSRANVVELPAADRAPGSPRGLGRRLVPFLLSGLLLLGLLPSRVAAHGALRSSEPGSGARLSVVPRELRLTFTEPVELSLARLGLSGPGGPVALARELSLAAGSPNVLVAGIEGRLLPGTHTVTWQVAGVDGHPVRGEYSFVIAPAALGLEPAPPQPTTASPGPPQATHHDPAVFPRGPGFDAGSPLYAAVRWLTFLGLLGTIGAVAFRIVLSIARPKEPVSGEALMLAAAKRAAQLGLGMAALTGIAALLRLYAQAYALGDDSGTLPTGMVAAMLIRTVWGWGWLLQIGGTALAMAGFALLLRGAEPAPLPADARRDVAGAGWPLAALGALVLSVTPGMSGHAVATRTLPPLPLLSDALHVLAAGGWLGGLLMIVVVGLPAALRLPPPERGPTIAALVNAFSPLALLLAGTVVATGIFAAWLHLGAISALWSTGYGLMLLRKLVVLTLLFGTGAYNWLRVKPSLGDELAAGRLRRSATVEIAVGALVLAITAILVATPPPTP